MKSVERAPNIFRYMPASFMELIKNEEVRKLVIKSHEDYSYYDKIKYYKLPDEVTIKDFWFLVKMRRMSSASTIKFGKYSFVWNTNNSIDEYLHFLDMNIGGSLESTSLIAKDEKNRYLVNSIMEEAIASSQIEGAVTSRRVAKEMLRKNQKPRDKSQQMILNNYITIQKILEVKSEPLNKENLLALHKLVSSNTMPIPEEEGAFKMDDDIKVYDSTTGDVVHDPPKLEELDALLNSLYNFFNEDDDKVFIHPLIKASIIHFMIGFIHPFADGNGRTGRALFYWYLLKKEYWLTEYLSISRIILDSKAQYAKAFIYTEIDENDMTYFILYNLKTMKLAFEELRKYIKRKQEEKIQLSNFMGHDGINYRQSLILEWFLKEPELLLTIKEAETRLAISNQSARLNLRELEAKKYISIVQINKKTKAYRKGLNFETLLSKMSKKKTREEKRVSTIGLKEIDNNQQLLF